MGSELDVRAEFPILNQSINGKPLVYLDSAASTQRPNSVLAAMDRFSKTSNANVHRGVHTLSQRATDEFESARVTVQNFVGADDSAEIIWTKGCTESLNLVAASWGGANLKPGDEILLTNMEHHANIVPWQLIAEKTGAVVRPIPISDDCVVDLQTFREMVTSRTKVVGIKHVCNATGVVNPVREMAEIAKSVGAIVVADGAQALAHVPVNVKELGVDFYAMSSHKVYGPMGVGALYGRRELLEAMPPFMGGGDMIRSVSFAKTTFNEIPNKFEPGTPNVSGVIGFAAALDWYESVGKEQIWAHENQLAQTLRNTLDQIPGVRTIGKCENQAPVVSFVMDDAHPHDVGTILDSHGVAIRTGHHCCMPLMERLGIPGTSRASFAVYNTNQEINVLIEALKNVVDIFSKC
ncbi:MAG: cysteine desulfurase [Fimbriimonadaceae bacterium]|nr:cysteine desulfurase [Fimbriimonadaceae bacterium]